MRETKDFIFFELDAFEIAYCLKKKRYYCPDCKKGFNNLIDVQNYMEQNYDRYNYKRYIKKK